jgi:cytoskeleton protein RodZ
VTTGIGDTLHQAREQQGRTLEDAARVLRVRGEQLRALEEERFDSFGGDVYAKGFLKSYAIELGLDPEPLLEEYRRKVAPAPVPASTLVRTSASAPALSRGAPPAWIAWVLVAVVVLAALGIIGSLGGRTPDVALPEQPQPGPSPTPSAPEDEEPTRNDDPPEEEVVPEPDGLELLLLVEERSWLRVTVDGVVVAELTAESGETLPFEAEESIEVRFGNAGGVRVELNGQDLGVPGGRGQVTTVAYTLDGPESV